MNADLHLNTGAMALHALPPDEESEFLDHLDTCETCAPEVAGFTETLARLGVLTVAEPPASLRERVMAAVAITPQLPPLTDEAKGRHRAPPAPTPETGPTGPTGPTAPAEPAETAEPLAPVIPIRAWYRRPAALIAAAVAAIVIIVGGVVVGTRGDSTPPVASDAACVAAATDATTVKPQVGTVGDVRYAPSCNAATISVAGLPAAPAGKAYQMWVINSDTDITSAGIMQPDPTTGKYATATIPVTNPNASVGISVEPAGGSPQPTTTPIWVAPLQS